TKTGYRLLAAESAASRRVCERITCGLPVAIRTALEVREHHAVGHGFRTAGRQSVRDELRSVKFSDEVLAAGAARDAVATNVDDEHPLLAQTAFDAQGKEVGTFPDAFHRAGLAEVAEVRPLLEIG